MAHRRLGAVLLLAVVAPVALAASAAYGQPSAPSDPTIEFTSTGTVPLVCATHPNVNSLAVALNTRIFLANLTGVDATIDIGRDQPISLTNGTGALVALPLGQYELRMVANCVVVEQTQAVVVSVQTKPPPSASAAESDQGQSNQGDSNQGQSDQVESGPQKAPVAAPGAPMASATGGVGDAPWAATGPAGAGRATPTARPGQPGLTVSAAAKAVGHSRSVLDGSLESEVIEVRRVPFGPANDPKGSRLLAIIAAICVFGVTTAIIRAILSQRTSSALKV